MTAQGHRLLTAPIIVPWLTVPDANRSIQAGGDQAVPVRSKRYVRYPFCMAAQGQHLIAGRDIPDFHRHVLPAGGKPPTVRAERQAPDSFEMSAQGLLHATGDSVPEFDFAARLVAPATAARCDELT